MSADDERAIGHLDEALDRFVSGQGDTSRPPSAPADLVGTHRRIQDLDRTPGPEPDFVQHLMEDLMHAATRSLNGSGRPASTKIVAQHAVPRRVAPPRLAPGPRGGFGRLALAALVLITLGLGYVVADPFGGSRRPSSIPAAVVPVGTPAVAASPPSAPVPPAGDAVIGVWAVYDDPHFPDAVKAWITFEPHGRFVRVGQLDRVEVGTWRVVDGRTVEIKFLVQQFPPPPLFDPAYAPAPLQITDKFEIWTLQATVDEGGNTMTLGGGWDVYEGGDKLFSAVYDGGRPVRMVLDPAVVTPTPGT